MKIAWFTPLAKASAIGRCGTAIAAELARTSEVDLWHPPCDDPHPTDVPTRRFTSPEDIRRETLAGYDILIYNLGNHLPFHKDIYLLARRFPGICVLHDFVLHHFFAGYFFELLRNPEGYVLAMQRHYGDAGRRLAEETVARKRRGVWESDEVVEYPLFEEALEGALGVVTHSEFLRRRVERVFPGPCRAIPLPYERPAGRPHSAGRVDLGIPEEAILLVSTGHVNPNKRIHVVIEALSLLGEHRFFYAVLGLCRGAYAKQLETQVRRLRLEPRVRFFGEVADEVLDGFLAGADICVNLRFPALEGASASAIEQMLHAKPVLVADTGFYSELPGDCVRRIPAGAGPIEVAAALRGLIEKPAERAALGVRARTFAESRFRTDLYARELLGFIREAGQTRPLLGLADRIGAELSLLGVTAEMRIVETLSRECAALFSEHRGK